MCLPDFAFALCKALCKATAFIAFVHRLLANPIFLRNFAHYIKKLSNVNI